ncbi:MAG: DUF5615 family PIN-like protein [Terriglobia bacterium]
MRFLVDYQLPIALARFLAARGWDCDHVMDLGLGSASDSAIWHYAHDEYWSERSAGLRLRGLRPFPRLALPNLKVDAYL